jgi:leader peptidase (prepilin peptidase) / N-methyltransferase
MNIPLIGGTLVGLALGASLLPVTRRELAAAVARSSENESVGSQSMVKWHRIALVLVSGLAPGLILARAGWSVVTIPPLVMLVGLVQLAYCDLTKFLLPKTMVHATTLAIAISAVVVGAAHHDWHRTVNAGIGGAALFALLLVINLLNPKWMAFGDVRLAPAVGLGLGWINLTALFQGFLLANLLTAVVGVTLMAVQRGDRKTAMPFGLYLAIASAAVLFYWS